MFKCQLCGKSSQKYEHPVMHVVEFRDKEYPERDGIYTEGRPDPGGYGVEIVKEIKIHDKCVSDAVAKYGST